VFTLKNRNKNYQWHIFWFNGCQEKGDFKMDGLLDKTFIPTLKKILSVATLNQKIIANNISNVSTPGYKAKEINKERAFKYIFEQMNTKQYSEKFSLKPSSGKFTEKSLIRESTQKSSNNGVNNVDIENEMAKLAENQIVFQTVARLIQRKFRSLSSSITGRIR
jgi:flagellar basal-body rod protein FlgB